MALEDVTTEEQLQLIKQWQDELIEICWACMLKENEEG